MKLDAGLHSIYKVLMKSVKPLRHGDLYRTSSEGSGVTSSRAPGGKMLLSRPPPPLRFNVECFTASLITSQIQRVRSAVNISSIWCFLPHKSLDPVAYVPRVSGAWGEDGNWRPSLQRVRLASAKALSIAIGGVWGGAPAANAFGSIWM